MYGMTGYTRILVVMCSHTAEKDGMVGVVEEKILGACLQIRGFGHGVQFSGY